VSLHRRPGSYGTRLIAEEDVNETEYTEDCCFNYERDHCRGTGCPCGCHAKAPRHDPGAVRKAAVDLTTAYLEDPGITLAGLRPHILALIEALDGVGTAP
jgi:hypothetical protein